MQQCLHPPPPPRDVRATNGRLRVFAPAFLCMPVYVMLRIASIEVALSRCQSQYTYSAWMCIGSITDAAPTNAINCCDRCRIGNRTDGLQHWVCFCYCRIVLPVLAFCCVRQADGVAAEMLGFSPSMEEMVRAPEKPRVAVPRNPSSWHHSFCAIR